MYRTCETTALTRLDIQRSSTEQCSAPSVIARVSHNEFWTFPTVGVVEQHNLNPLLEPINQGFRHCTTDRTGSLQNGSVSSFWLMVQLCQFQQFMQFIVHAWGITWRYEKDLFRSPKVQKIPEVPRKAALHAPQDGCDGCSAAQSSSLSCANRRSVDDPSPGLHGSALRWCYDDVRRVTYDVLRTTCYEYHPGVPPHLPFLRFLRLLVPGQLLQQTDASLQPLQLPEKDRELITLITSITSNVANQSGCQK